MLTSELLKKVYLYIDGEISIKEFEDWYVPQVPQLFSMPHSSITDLVATLELGLAEMGSGARTEDEFKALLKDFLQKEPVIRFDYPEEDRKISTASSAQHLFTIFVTADFVGVVSATL